MAKIFTRIDTGTARQTLRIFQQEIAADKRRFIKFTLVIPIAHFLRYVFAPLMMSFILQSLITKPHDIATPLWLIAAMAVATVVTIVANNRGFTWLFQHEEHISTRLTERAMTSLMQQSYQFFADHRVGSLSGDVVGFNKSYITILDTLSLQASHIVINYVSSLVVIAFLAPAFLLPLFLLTVGVVILSIRSLNKRSVFRNKRKVLTTQLNGLIADTLGNQILAKIFSRETDEVNAAISQRQEIEKIAAKEIAIIERESIYRQLLLFVFQTAALVGGMWLYSQNLVTIAALVFIVTYLGRITDSMYSITSIIRMIEQAFLDAAPLTKILFQQTDVSDAPHAQPLHVRQGTVDCTGVNFYYKDAEQETVFSNLSLHIPAGQRVGLAGFSGGGKTTLTKLLLRFADVSGGSITIDGQNIATVTQASLRDAIAYVPQEPFLFHRTLRENIAYGKPNATDTEVLAAAQKAHAMEFINKLPKGLDTVVGERGVKLSGGQRQRIAIARAILKNAPILILDEATSALDSESEQLIQSALAKLMHGRTSIVIAHRLSTIAKLDRIVVLDNGRIVEDGTHTELLEAGGTYASLWQHQSGGFIDDSLTK